MTPECRDEVCVTCADELLAVTLDWVDARGITARGHVDGTELEVSVELLDGARPGDVVLAHGGVALQRAAETQR